MSDQATPPDPLAASIARGFEALTAKRWREATGIAEDVLAADAGHAPAHALRAEVHIAAGEIDAAIDRLKTALAAAPNAAGWRARLSTLYRAKRNPAEALQWAESAMQIDPANLDHMRACLLALMQTEDLDRARRLAMTMIGKSPELADSHQMLGEILLKQGNYAPGWIEYEWRTQTSAGKANLPNLGTARWNGMRMTERLLVVADQSYDDSLQFARYLPEVAKRCPDMIVGCSAHLAPLLRAIPGVTAAYTNWNEAKGHAAFTRASSLPLLFHTEISTIPNQFPYLHAPVDAAAACREQLRSALPANTLKVGLAWRAPFAGLGGGDKNLSLQQLLPLTGTPGIAFVSLQTPVFDQELPLANGFTGLRESLAPLNDFGGIAAIAANLDLIITADSAIAHLGGALAVPTWVLLPKPCDWRWLLERDDTPWYPSLRLFRQSRIGDWNDPIVAVRHALRATLAAATGTAP
jgi:tetratricopeptide (TPR) repeat protein